MTRQPSPFLEISDAVERALVRSEPVVALESSLIAHGFPRPLGLEAARAAERRVREIGAVPATIAVIDGSVRVGLVEGELERLVEEPEVRKVGPRDLATCAISGRCGATTVAGTMAVCRIAGIHFLATGGIGGVHRDWAETRDESADIHELAEAPVCVVCSGVKSILDVGATLELLETLGVPVIGYGTDCFPLFLQRESSFPVADRADDPVTVATVAAAHWGFARNTGVLVAQPVAADAGVEEDDVEPLVVSALAEARADGITGAGITPHVLRRLHEGSGGRTLAANRRLIEDNAALAALIASAYYRV